MPLSNHRRDWVTGWSVGRLLRQRWPLPAILSTKPGLMDPGRRLHEWTFLNDTGAWCPTLAPDDPIAGWAEAWKRFGYTFSPSWDYREKVFEVSAGDDLPMGFHGIVDCAGSLRGKMTVLDIKTGGPADQHGVQLAFYALGLFPQTARNLQRANVYVRKNGSYRLVVRDDPRDFVACQELLQQAKETHGYSKNTGARHRTA
jgi:hypothetical protein